MAKKNVSAAPAPPPVTYASAMDKIRDEMAKSKDNYVQVVGEYLTDYLLAHPEAEAALLDKPCRLIRCGRCGWTDIEEKRGGRYPGSYIHNDTVGCPHCCSVVTVKHPSKGIKRLENQLDVVFYRKSAVDPAVVVALAAHCTRFFCLADVSEPWELEPNIDVRGIAVFDVAHRDDIRSQSRPLWQQNEVGTYTMAGTVWKRVKSMKALQFGTEALFMYQRPDRAALTDTFETAIRGTPVERAWSDKYWNGTDGIMALDMITRRPCVEYMTKLGLENFVVRQVDGTLPPRLVNWSGKSMSKVLRLSRDRLGQIKGKGIHLSVDLCTVLQYVDRRGIRCGIETAEGVAVACRDEAAEIARALDEALEFFPQERRHLALKYIGRHRDQTLSDIVDLWRMIVAAGGALTDADAFPRDFRQAHNRMLQRITAAANAAQDKKIAARAVKLASQYGFEFGGLILRPAMSAAELVREGQLLHHCVGSYVEKYASGATAIFVLRRAVQPDEPWRTVEINPKSGKVVQDRGLHNDWNRYEIDDTYRAMLAMFWEAWDERKQTNRGRKSA